MLARDWYYNERRQIGLNTAVASIYNTDDDSDLRARAALTMLGVQRGWRVAGIGRGNGGLGSGAGVRGGADRRRSRRHRYFAGDAAAGRNPGARPQGRGSDPVGGLVELRLSAELLRPDRQRIHAASSAGFLEGGGAVADP